MKKYSGKWKYVLLLLLMFFCLAGGNTKTVSADTDGVSRCRVVFANKKGKVSTQLYKSWEQIVEQGSYINLPEYSKPGYKVFWVKKTNGKLTRYNPGAKVRINGNTKFYMYYYKLYTVKFYTANGKKEYKKLRLQGIKGQYVTLPDYSVSSGASVKWATKVKGTDSRKPGSRLKITGNMKFYLVSETSSASAVKLLYNNGKVWKTVNNASGTATFPSVDLQSDMCLGWSRRKGQSTNPEYKTGDKIPSKSGTYYMVVFKESMDKRPAVLESPYTYDKVLFVGDSRTLGMQVSLGAECPEQVDFVCKVGKGLAWFKKYGYKELITKLEQEPSETRKAIIFNLGVNDLENYNKYVKYMNSIASGLNEYNCDLYYMSINPFNKAMYKGTTVKRSDAKIARFNKAIYNQLCSGRKSSYRYINTCTNLQKYGWISTRPSDGAHDGLHYSVATYLRIYNYCIRYLNRF